MQFINLQIFLRISRFHCVIRRRNISQNSAIKLTRFLYLEKHCTIPISAILLHLIISHFAVIILILRMVFRCNAWLQFYSCTLPSSLLSSLSVGFSILSIFSFHWFHKFIQIIVIIVIWNLISVKTNSDKIVSKMSLIQSWFVTLDMMDM